MNANALWVNKENQTVVNPITKPILQVTHGIREAVSNSGKIIHSELLSFLHKTITSLQHNPEKSVQTNEDPCVLFVHVDENTSAFSVIFIVMEYFTQRYC